MATVKGDGESPPKRRPLPTGVKDDQAHSDDGGETVYLRVTLAKAVCGRELFNRAQMHPRCLPAFLLMSPMLKKVLATRGAVAYDEEVTCLILVKKTDTDVLLEAGATGGAFVMSHRELTPPKWILRDDSILDDQDYEQALAAVKVAGGRLVYRPKARSSLGIVGAARPFEGAIQPTWYVHGAPVVWDDDQLLEWVQERGFVGAKDPLRRGKQAWTFRAAEPKGTTGTTTFAFTFGIAIGLATSASRRKATTPLGSC